MVNVAVKIPDIVIDNSNFCDIFIFFFALILFLINIKILMKKVIVATNKIKNQNAQ